MKKIFILILVLLMGLILGGCHDENTINHPIIKIRDYRISYTENEAKIKINMQKVGGSKGLYYMKFYYVENEYVQKTFRTKEIYVTNNYLQTVNFKIKTSTKINVEKIKIYSKGQQAIDYKLIKTEKI